ncbi:hypothetical protein KQX54_000397 [Cotesia glomerata]|uniref:Uncharacterized protein n=1 Tax=Cotesia glomerata TaxID=32391 RepID=A0AAV7I0T0_COTGL|nr:hypothetical protein KQX54_000397 [Cotesia glomerata]
MLSNKNLLLLLLMLTGHHPKEFQVEVPLTIQCPDKNQVIYKIELEFEEFTPLTVGIWIRETYYWLPIAPYYIIEIKNGTDLATYHIPNVFYRGGPVVIRD